MRWLVVCDPGLPLDRYGDVLSAIPPAGDVSGCPAGWRAAYLEATVEQVRALQANSDRICRLRPVWDGAGLSPAELLVLRRRLHASREGEEKP